MDCLDLLTGHFEASIANHMAKELEAFLAEDTLLRLGNEVMITESLKYLSQVVLMLFFRVAKYQDVI